MKNKKSNKELADKFAENEEKRKKKEFKKNLLNFIKKCERNDELSIK